MITIREYKTGDAKKIYTMFASHTSYKRDACFWVWINRLLSDDSSIIVVAEKSEEIVGHYAIIPRKAVVQGVILNAGIGIHAFVDPAFRNEISIFDISAYAYKVALNRNLDFIYGFPNSDYRLIQEKIEKWKRISLFKAYEKVNDKDLSGDLVLNLKWEPIELLEFDKLFAVSEIFDKYVVPQSIYLKKSLPYFCSRYLHHPQTPYQVWILKRNTKDIGYIVTKLFEAENETRAHIIDYMLAENIDLNLLLKDFENKFKKLADKFVLWPMNKKFEDQLIKNQYSSTGFETFFGIKPISNKAKTNLDYLLEYKNWHLTMGDSDAF